MDSALLLIIVMAVGLAVFVWWVRVLIEALRTPSQQWAAAGQNQLVYIVLMVLLGVIGTLLYIAVARPQLRAVAAPAAG